MSEKEIITKEEFKTKIVEIIVNLQGCKAVELITKLDMQMVNALDVYDLSTVLAELLHECKLVEIEYELPLMNYRTKSFLLPGGTKIIINNGAL